MKFSNNIIQQFSKQKIVILGDLVADQFLRGTIARVSREAPVFILRHDETETLAGGAANAAVNVASLGAKAVLVGFIGKDLNGAALLEELKSSKVNCDFLVESEKFQTTTKVRVIAGQQYAARQQVIRIDYANQEEIGAELQDQLQGNLRRAAKDADAIIISDYDYGAATAATVEIARKIADEKNIPLIVDSRFRLSEFRGAASATPNQDEVEQILGEDFTEDDCIRLCERLDFQSLLITRGNLGIMLIEQGEKPFYLEAVGAKEPVDVTGAGDTVIAVYGLALASGSSFMEAAEIANHAGGIVVMKKGTAAVGLDELIASIEKSKITPMANKSS
ncbi:MAG: bifunctional heptose 7-phosphate kinase/heptose 1-phosphate adenyltransferase [Pyrinomonadaceae bacterium]